MIHVGPDNVEPGTGRLSQCRTAQELGLISGKYLFRPGDIVYSKIRPYLRKSFFAESPGLCSADMYPLRTGAGFDGRYVHFFTLSDSFTQQAVSQQDRTGIPKLNRQQLSGILIPQPPLQEQRAIAAVLCRIQTALEAQHSIAARLRDLKAATVAKLFREGLLGESLRRTEVGYVPESWAVMRFGEFATLQRGFDLPAHERSAGTVPVIGSNGIVGWHSEVKAKAPGVITGRSGSIGRSFYSEVDFWPLNTALFVTDFHGNHPAFVHCLLERFDLGQFSAGVSVPTLNRNLVHGAAVAVPSLLEQIEISRVDVALDNALDLAEQKRQALAVLFGSMLHLLITGQLWVPPDLIGPTGAQLREAQGTSAQGGEPHPAGQRSKPDEALLQEIVRRIVEAVAPEKIILFGSAARGEMGPDSDLDLLVVKACERPRDLTRQIRRHLRDVAPGLPKEIVVVTPEHLERHRDTIGYIYRPALREGRVLYAV